MSGFAASRNRRLLIDSKNHRGQSSSTESGVRVGAIPGEANAASSSLSKDSNG